MAFEAGRFVSLALLTDRLDPPYYLGNQKAFINGGTGFQKLKDLAAVRRNRSDFFEKQTWNYIELSNLNAERGEIIDPQILKRDELPQRARYKVYSGDVLVGLVRPERGAVAIIPSELDNSVASSAFAILTPVGISHELLYFILRSREVRLQISQAARGGVMPTISLSELMELAVPVLSPADVQELQMELPGLLEQLHSSLRQVQEIPGLVAQCLSELLPGVAEDDSLGKRDFSVPYQLLTPDRLDVVSYSPERESLLGSAAKSDLDFISLGQVAESREVGANIKSDIFSQQGWPVLRNTDVHPGWIEEGSAFPSQKDTKLPIVRHNQVLVSLSGSNVGMAAWVPDHLEGVTFNHSLAALDLIEGIDPRFVCIAMNSEWGQRQLKHLQKVSGRPYLTLGALMDFMIPQLPLSEQQELAEPVYKEIEKRRKRHRQAEQRYQELEERYLGRGNAGDKPGNQNG
ncbi:MAG: hypothetical protein ACM3PE_01885 [Deltaproteobacteria bacterium]